MAKRRFYFHYNKQTKMASLHWNGQCIPVHDIKCHVETETKWNNRQPRFVVQGKAVEVRISGRSADRILAEIW